MARHAHDRHHHRHAADVLARAHARAPVLDDRHVGAGPADVERDDVRQAGAARDVGGADDAGGRPGQQRRGRLRACGGDGHDAAVRLRDVRHRRGPARGERLLEPFEVALHLGLHVRVEDGQRGALVLARLRPDVGGGGHRNPGSRLLGDGPSLLLVLGPPIRVQQRDHEALDALTAAGQVLHRLAHAALVERRVDGAVGAQPLADFGDAGARNQRQGPRAVQIERVRHPQALELEDVAEPVGDEQAEPRAGPLDQACSRRSWCRGRRCRSRGGRRRARRRGARGRCERPPRTRGASRGPSGRPARPSACRRGRSR